MSRLGRASSLLRPGAARRSSPPGRTGTGQRMVVTTDDPRVVVLKTSPYPLHPGTIGVARTLGRLGIPVDVVGDDPAGPVGRSRYVRSVHPLPTGLPPDDLSAWLCATAPPGRPVLIPMDDVGAMLVSEHSGQLLEHYRFPVLPAGLVATVSDKAGLAELAAAAGVPTPTLDVADTAEQLEEAIATATFPVVVKARDPRLLEATGSKSVTIAHDAVSLREQWGRHQVDGKSNCVLQEYVPGGPETVWMVNAYVDATSSMHLAASARKIRQRPAYTGATTLGVCQRNDEVLALTAQLVRSIGYRGVLDIGWRFDARDGKYKVLDLNPRVGATFRLFASACGEDVVRALYADLTDRPLPRGETPDGRRWLSEIHDLAVARRYIRDGAMTPGGYLRSLRGVTESVWWAADDPVPAVTAMSVALGRLRQRWAAPRPASQVPPAPVSLVDGRPCASGSSITP